MPLDRRLKTEGTKCLDVVIYYWKYLFLRWEANFHVDNFEKNLIKAKISPKDLRNKWKISLNNIILLINVRFIQRFQRKSIKNFNSVTNHIRIEILQHHRIRHKIDKNPLYKDSLYSANLKIDRNICQCLSTP